MVTERTVGVVLCREYRSLERGQLVFPDDRDILIAVDLVLGQPSRRRSEVIDICHGVFGHFVSVCVVLEDRVALTLVFPALEDVPDSVGVAFPIKVSL